MKRFVSKCLNKARTAMTRAAGEKGFTLVELVVVIAILGILAGVGTVGYSGYVKKANMAADQQLVSQVANALQLQYYANPTAAASDYVVLKVDADAEDGGKNFADPAMKAAFGDEWKKMTSLKYGEWSDDGLLSLVADYTDEELAAIADSTFMTVATPKGLMTAVTDMTGIVSSVIAGSDLSQATNRLNILLGAESDTVKTLNSLNMQPTDADYPTVVSNLLVNEMANMMQNAENADNKLNTILYLYSAAYAYSQVSGDPAILNQLSTNLDGMSFDELNSDAYLEKCIAGMEDIGFSDFEEFQAATQDTDVAALSTMMGAVGHIAGSYKDKDSLVDPGLYASGAVAEQVNNYMTSVKAMVSMTPAERAALKNQADTVMVFITADGKVSVTPAAAWVQAN